MFDQSYYKQVYDEKPQSFGAAGSRYCDKLEDDLPKMTAFFRNNYNSIAANLGQRRAEENRQMLDLISRFKVTATSAGTISVAFAGSGRNSGAYGWSISSCPFCLLVQIKSVF